MVCERLKSSSAGSPSFRIKTLLGFKSLCKTPRAWAWARAPARRWKIQIASSPQPSAANVSNGRIAATSKALYAGLHLANTNVVGANQFTLFANVNLISGLAKLDGFYALWLPWLTDAQQRLHDSPNSLSQGFADFIGARWVLAVDAKTGRRFEWHPRESAMPLVSVGQKPVSVSPEVPPDYLADPEFDPRAGVSVLSSPDSGLPDEAVPEAKINDLRIKAHGISFNVSSPLPTIAVIAPP